MTIVVNIRKSEYDFYGGRGKEGKIPDPPEYGWCGNPFSKNTRGKNISDFREYFANRMNNDPIYRAAIFSLKDLTLGCFCKPMDCHLDVIKEFLDS